ncbi:hypothetical protein LO772_29575 [Yinghuangia sp. ASG 101]|uniref:hypothetical protein n=1 Tax=Yinghuangia sp. ASG 101 TaxID=2896848 RepID=UPI001E327CD5|nr:hypothetical protein [Yinghuangia sp. ASG 101]UGQ10922.1 hypothetical protein LO772_29575 [Yinghuangia sp. ASG 101]
MTEVLVGAFAGAVGGAVVGWTTAYATFRLNRAEQRLARQAQRDEAGAEFDRELVVECAAALWTGAHETGPALAELRRTGATDLDDARRDDLLRLAQTVRQRGMVLGEGVYDYSGLLQALALSPTTGNRAAMAETVVHHMQWVAVAHLRHTGPTRRAARDRHHPRRLRTAPVQPGDHVSEPALHLPSTPGWSNEAAPPRPHVHECQLHPQLADVRTPDKRREALRRRVLKATELSGRAPCSLTASWVGFGPVLTARKNQGASSRPRTHHTGFRTPVDRAGKGRT